MNTHHTRQLIVAVMISFAAGLGLLNLYSGSKMLTASTAVVVALVLLGIIEFRQSHSGERLKSTSLRKRSHA